MQEYCISRISSLRFTSIKQVRSLSGNRLEAWELARERGVVFPNPAVIPHLSGDPQELFVVPDYLHNLKLSKPALLII